MKKILNLALGIGALVATSMSVTPEAKAVTWGPTVGPWDYDWWRDVNVDADISTTGTTSWYGTYADYWTPNASNVHRGGYYVQCVGQTLYGWPAWGPTWTGWGNRWSYTCPNGASISSSYGWVDDNYYQ